jgi:hypothetical protein
VLSDRIPLVPMVRIVTIFGMSIHRMSLLFYFEVTTNTAYRNFRDASVPPCIQTCPSSVFV